MTPTGDDDAAAIPGHHGAAQVDEHSGPRSTKGIYVLFSAQILILANKYKGTSMFMVIFLANGSYSFHDSSEQFTLFCMNYMFI